MQIPSRYILIKMIKIPHLCSFVLIIWSYKLIYSPQVRSHQNASNLVRPALFTKTLKPPSSTNTRINSQKLVIPQSPSKIIKAHALHTLSAAQPSLKDKGSKIIIQALYERRRKKMQPLYIPYVCVPLCAALSLAYHLRVPFLLLVPFQPSRNSRAFEFDKGDDA